VDLPKPINYELPKNKGGLKYNVRISDKQIKFRREIEVNNPFFTEKEYHSLKELFNHIFEIQANQFSIKEKIDYNIPSFT